MAALHTSEHTRTVALADPAATAALAAEISVRLVPGDAIALTGDLGAGKTVFARALIVALGKASGIEVGHVPSPTFTLVQLYDLPGFTVYHFDLYRLAAPDDVWETGIEDALADGVSVIEWADRIDGLLPPRTIHIHLAFGDGETARVATVSEAAR